jgi:hypothetical protein
VCCIGILVLYDEVYRSKYRSCTSYNTLANTHNDELNDTFYSKLQLQITASSDHIIYSSICAQHAPNPKTCFQCLSSIHANIWDTIPVFFLVSDFPVLTFRTQQLVLLFRNCIPHFRFPLHKYTYPR